MKTSIVALFFGILFCSCGTDRITPATNSEDSIIGQYFTYLYDSLKEEDALERANADFNEDKYYIMDFGEMAGVPDLDRNIDSIYETYNVRACQAGCVVRQPARTYSDEMLRLLETGKRINSGSIFGIMYFDERKVDRRLDSTRIADSLANVH